VIAPITVAGSHTLSTDFQAPWGIAVKASGPSGVLAISGMATAVGASAGSNATVMDVYGTGTEVLLSGSVTLADARDNDVTDGPPVTVIDNGASADDITVVVPGAPAPARFARVKITIP
jgi:hypothetical protein